VVPKSKWRITLQGAGRDVTKITSRNVAGDTGTTYTTSTFGVSAPYFTARNISFEVSQHLLFCNTADNPIAVVEAQIMP
jgi:pectinesterase